jgi:chloramphenicol 3-O-phosphotransferase
MTTPPGPIVLLNGASGVGKSTLVAALQQAFAVPCVALGIDNFLIHLSPQRYLPIGAAAADGLSWQPIANADPPETELHFGPACLALLTALHHAVAGVSRSGLPVAVDYCLQEATWMQEWVMLWADLPVLLVHVTCPLDVLEHRVAERSNRPPIARAVTRWHALHGLVHCPYDLTIDTAQCSPSEGAAAILHFLDTARPTAFHTLISTTPTAS